MYFRLKFYLFYQSRHLVKWVEWGFCSSRILMSSITTSTSLLAVLIRDYVAGSDDTAALGVPIGIGPVQGAP